MIRLVRTAHARASATPNARAPGAPACDVEWCGRLQARGLRGGGQRSSPTTPTRDLDLDVPETDRRAPHHAPRRSSDPTAPIPIVNPT